MSSANASILFLRENACAAYRLGFAIVSIAVFYRLYRSNSITRRLIFIVGTRPVFWDFPLSGIPHRAGFPAFWIPLEAGF